MILTLDFQSQMLEKCITGIGGPIDMERKGCEFPHSAFARGPRSPALEEGMRAAMGATRERCEGPCEGIV